MSDASPAASLAQVQAWAGDPSARGEFSPLSRQRLLLVDTSRGRLAKSAQARIAAWLRELPSPSIAIAAADNPIARACDVTVANEEAATGLIENINRHPIAATVLVQLLRITEKRPIADALSAESLAYATLQAGPEFRKWLEENRAPTFATPKDAGPAVVIHRDDNRLQLELNRPSNHNAMSIEMRDALVEALQFALADRSIRQVRITARGKCFSTGGDLSEFGTAPDPATAHVVRSLSVPGRLLAQGADRVHVQVHGACVGSGIEFPAFAQKIVAAGNAWFQLPELAMGLIPGAGGCVSIARRIGRQRTAWLALSGKRINARLALEWGLVDSVIGVSSHSSDRTKRAAPRRR
jgi:enoyl-CoA hydratase/carnithine racemase